MKITDSQVIRDGEKELINAVKDEIDPEKIRELIAHKLSAGSLKAKDGQIVIHNNQIAFRLDFEMQFSGSILLDREGNLLSDEADEPEGPQFQIDEEERQSLESHDDNSEEEPLLPEEELDTDFPEDTLSEETGDDNPEDELSDSEILELPEQDATEEELLDSDLEDLEGETLEDIETEELDSDLEKDDEEDTEPPIPDDILPDEKDDSDSQEDMIDDNINEILEESRAFWQQNKKD